MKRILFLLCIALIYGLPAAAQKRQRLEEKPTVNENQRKQSIIFANGLRAFYSDNFPQAEEDFRTVISQNPDHDASFYMLGKIRETAKDYDGAAYYMEEARKIDKNNPWYIIEMARIQGELKDFKQSAKLWEEAAKLKPDNEYYLIALGDAYLQQGKFSEAIKTYERLESLVGTTDEIVEVKKRIHLYQNDIKSAVGEYERLLLQYPDEVRYDLEIAKIYMTNDLPGKAYPYLQTAWNKDPENPFLNMALSDYYEQQGKKDEAFKYLLAAFRNPDLPLSSKMPAMHNAFNDVLKDKDEKQARKVRTLADALVDAHPDAVEGWKMIAALQFLRENYADARITFEKILSLDPTDYGVWADYLFSLMKVKDYQTIANNADEISELFPTHAEMLYHLGNAYLALKQADKAVDYLNQASMFAFDLKLAAAISLSLGDAYQLLGNKTEAVKAWKQAQRKGINTKELQDKISENE